MKPLLLILMIGATVVMAEEPKEGTGKVTTPAIVGNRQLNARKSNNHFTSPQFTAVAALEDKLVFWLKADKGVETTTDGAVLRWEDGSLNHKQAWPADAPVFTVNGIGGKPCVTFDRSNPIKIELGDQWPTDEVTIFVVAQCAEPQKGENNLFQAFPVQNGNLFQAHLPHQNGHAYWDIGGNRSSFRIPDGGNPQIWEFTAKPGVGQVMSVNGAQKAAVKTNGKFDHAGKHLLIGNQFKGALAELIICNRALDEAARNRIGGALTEKYAIKTTYQPAPQTEKGMLTIAEAVLWLKADAGIYKDCAGKVLAWEDQSSRRSTAALPALPKRSNSVNGKPAIHFSGNQKLVLPLPSGWPSKNISIFAVVRRAHEKPGAGSLLAVTPAVKVPFTISLPFQSGEINWIFGTHHFLATCTNPGTPQIFEWSATEGKGKAAFIDGTICASSLVDSALTPDGKTLTLGEGLNGDIAEVMVYSRSLSVNERNQVGFHLAQKYHIAANYLCPIPQAAAAIDLGKDRTITAIQVKLADSEVRTPYTIESSADGQTWHTVVDNRLAETAVPLHVFDAVTARHFRLVPALRGNGKLPVLAEFRAFRQEEIPAGLAAIRPANPLWPDECPGLKPPQYHMLPDTYAWIVAHNKRQVIDAKFLETAPVPTEILLPNGQVESLQKIKQLFDHNFRIYHYGTGLYNTPEKQEIIKILNERYRRQLAHPLLWEFVASHGWHQNPAEGSQLYTNALNTYTRFRRAHKTIPMFTYSMGAAGMSNGSNVALATWVPLAVNGRPFHVMTHETSHCLGFNDGCGFAYGFDNYMAGKFGARAWDYEIVDPNTIRLIALPEPALPRLPAVPLATLKARETPPPAAFRSSNASPESPLVVDGVVFTSGLGLASDTAVSFDIPQGATRFVAVAGLDDAGKDHSLAACVFEVYADQTLVARSPQLCANSRRWWTFDAPLPAAAKSLRILARNTIDNRNGKVLIPVPTVWGNAGFAFAPYPQVATEPTTPAAQHPQYYPATNLLATEISGQTRRQFAYYPDGKKRWETTTLADGTWDGPHREWFADGAKQVEATYRNGKLLGLHTEWYANGKKQSEKHYKDGVLDAAITLWRNDGTLALESACRDGKTSGLVRKYYPDGTTRQLEETHDQGIRHGVMRAFHPNGKPAEEWNYAKGVLDGVHAKYDANGVKLFEETFAQNLLHGIQAYWFPTGKKQVEAHYKENKLNGERTAWHANGQVAETSSYTNGMMDGVHVKFYPTGIKQMEETYVKNLLHGVKKTWHGNGTKILEEKFQDNQLQGVRAEWHANGKKKAEDTYKDNRKHGRSQQWDGNGKLVSDLTFENGNVKN